MSGNLTSNEDDWVEVKDPDTPVPSTTDSNAGREATEAYVPLPRKTKGVGRLKWVF